MDVRERDEAEYFRRREQQERLLAESASSPDIRSLHARMADHYAERAAAPMPLTAAR